MLVKDGQKTTSNRIRKIRHFFRFIFWLSRFRKVRTILDALVRTIYIPSFTKCAKDGAPDYLWLVETSKTKGGPRARPLRPKMSATILYSIRMVADVVPSKRSCVICLRHCGNVR